MAEFCGLMDDEDADEDDKLFTRPRCPPAIAAWAFMAMVVDGEDMLELAAISIPSAPPDEADDVDDVESCSVLFLSFLLVP